MSIINRIAFTVLYLLAMASVALWMLSEVASAKDPLFKIAVIDTGLDRTDARFQGKLCETGHYNFVHQKSDTFDTDGHGTYIAGLITKYASAKVPYCLLIYKFYDTDQPDADNAANSVMAVRMAIKEGASLINMSYGGKDFVESEYLALKDAPTSVTFIAAAGNDGKELNKAVRFYPASYKLPNVTVVGALDHKGARLKASNYGADIVAWELGEGPLAAFPNGSWGAMVGSSISTAIYTARLISYRGRKQ